jgi:hypothetical protein
MSAMYSRVTCSPVTPGDGRSDPIAAVRQLSRRATSGPDTRGADRQPCAMNGFVRCSKCQLTDFLLSPVR